MTTRHPLLATLLTAAVAVAAFPLDVQAEGAKSTAVTRALVASKPVTSGHIAVNGINYYHEVHGKGEPLKLLHGGLGSIDMFRAVLPTLAKTRRVIAVDLHGHGRTALGARNVDGPGWPTRDQQRLRTRLFIGWCNGPSTGDSAPAEGSSRCP